MIQPGDKFSLRELRQSVNEVLDANSNVRLYGGTPPLNVLVGDNLIDLLRCSPQTYANYRIEEFSDIKSSAINLDKQLRDKGFKTTYKFSYKYFTPGLKSEQIIKDAYCLEYFQNLSLLISIRPGARKQFKNIFEDAFRISYYYAQYLWAHNPQICENIAQKLKCPGMENWGQIIGAIQGIGFHFSPNDIYEFSVNHINPDISKDAYEARYAQQAEFKDMLMKKYGVDTGCLVLSPEHQDKLIKILTKTDTPYLIQVLSNLRLFKLR